MKARILLPLSILFLLGCHKQPSICECIDLVEELQSLKEPLEPDDPRISKLQKCDKANDDFTEQERAKAKLEAEKCK